MELEIEIVAHNEGVFHEMRSAGPDVAAGIVSDLAEASGIVMPVQTHSCNVGVIGEDGMLPAMDDTDALICLKRGIRIGVRTADCVPVLLYAPDIPAVAAIHAGWRGSLGGIVTVAVGKLKELGASPAEIYAAFGPCICGNCYEVSPELVQEFRNGGFGSCIRKERNLDLEQVNTERLLRAGVQPEHITPSPCCTLETTTFPSWRRGATDRRLVTWISIE